MLDRRNDALKYPRGFSHMQHQNRPLTKRQCFDRTFAEFRAGDDYIETVEPRKFFATSKRPNREMIRRKREHEQAVGNVSRGGGVEGYACRERPVSPIKHPAKRYVNPPATSRTPPNFEGSGDGTLKGIGGVIAEGVSLGIEEKCGLAADFFAKPILARIRRCRDRASFVIDRYGMQRMFGFDMTNPTSLAFAVIVVPGHFGESVLVHFPNFGWAVYVHVLYVKHEFVIVV